MNTKDIVEDTNEQMLIEGRLRMKILDAQKLLLRNKENINPVLYTELLTILERPTTDLSEERLEEICEIHR